MSSTSNPEPYEPCCQHFDEGGEHHSSNCPNHVPHRKSLFTSQYSTYTPDAMTLDREISGVVRPIIQRYFDMGYSIRDIAYVAQSSVTLIESTIQLTYSGRVGTQQSKLRRQRMEHRLQQRRQD